MFIWLSIALASQDHILNFHYGDQIHFKKNGDNILFQVEDCRCSTYGLKAHQQQWHDIILNAGLTATTLPEHDYGYVFKGYYANHPQTGFCNARVQSHDGLVFVTIQHASYCESGYGFSNHCNMATSITILKPNEAIQLAQEFDLSNW